MFSLLPKFPLTYPQIYTESNTYTEGTRDASAPALTEVPSPTRNLGSSAGSVWAGPVARACTHSPDARRLSLPGLSGPAVQPQP